MSNDPLLTPFFLNQQEALIRYRDEFLSGSFATNAGRARVDDTYTSTYLTDTWPALDAKLESFDALTPRETHRAAFWAYLAEQRGETADREYYA